MCRVYICVCAGENENKNLKLFFLTYFFVFVNLINILLKNQLGSYFLDFFELLSSVESHSCVRLFATPWTGARKASLSFTNFRSSPKPMSIESVMPSSHHILCRPLLLLPSIFPSFRVFSDEWPLHQVAKVLEFQLQHQSFQWTLRTDLL